MMQFFQLCVDYPWFGFGVFFVALTLASNLFKVRITNETKVEIPDDGIEIDVHHNHNHTHTGTGKPR